MPARPPAASAGSQSSGRHGSLARALTLVHTHRVDRRSALTDQLGLTRTATGTVLGELERLHLIRVDSRAGAISGIGRPSHRITIHPDAPVAVGVQLQAETVEFAVVGLGGAVGPVTTRPLPEPATPWAVLGLVADRVRDVLGAERRRCVGVGVGLPSAVARADGSALAALNLDWPPVTPVGAMLRDLLVDRGTPTPVHVGNDANLAALAEYRHGAGAGAGDLLYVTTGQRGVGGGLVLGGILHTGSAGYALEVGHLTVEPDGRLCHCGNRGCLEVEADPAALLRAAGQVVGAGPALPLAAAVIARSNSDPAARAAVLMIARRLGIGLGSLINVLNPDRILLGGMYADLLRAADTCLRGELTRRSFIDHAARVDLHAGQLTAPTLVGAAELAFQPLLDNPRRAADPRDPAVSTKLPGPGIG